MNNNDMIRELIKKSRLDKPVPAEVQAYIRENKGRQFKKIMKKAGVYSVLFGLISNLFFYLKRIGLGVTIVKTAVILTVTAVIIISFTTAGLYMLGRGYFSGKIQEKVEILDGNKGALDLFPAGNKIDKALPENDAASESDRVGVQQFVGVNVPASRAAETGDLIYEKLSSMTGSDRVVNFRKGRKKAGVLLMGSIEYLNNGYMISARLVNIKDSKIIYYTSENIISLDELERACQSISTRIAEKIK